MLRTWRILLFLLFISVSLVTAVLGGLATHRSSPALASGGPSTIAAGAYHSCTVTTAGAAMCWGRDQFGQLGDGGITASRFPAPVVGLGSGVAAISAGGDHTCALLVSGAVKCWGENFSGELGDGTTASRNTPVDVIGLSGGVIEISAGQAHSCALLTGGAVKCWGNNGEGQLGDNHQCISPCTHPVDVIGLSSGIAAVGAGGLHSCALTKGGSILCWGSNYAGQLGDGTHTRSFVPISVPSLTGASAVATGGEHTCALIGGGVKCWGENVKTPQDIVGLTSGVARIAAAYEHTCVVTTIGGAKCWHYYSTPADVPTLTSGVGAIAVGQEHNCAVMTSGVAKCWGSAFYGQVGDGTIGFRNTPVHVASLSGTPLSIATGAYHTCAVKSTGAAQCWGANNVGQLGNGTLIASLTPSSVVGLGAGTTVKIAAGDNRTCAITTAGAARCWGAGYLGDGTTFSSSTPVSVSGLGSGVSSIGVGEDHSCAVQSGAAQCWGANGDGQLGDGTVSSSQTPVSVSGLASGVSSVAAGAAHSCAVMTTGTVKCWGANSSGQLGDGTFTESHAPVDVSGLANVATIAAAGNETCAVTTAGSVYCWGSGVSVPTLVISGSVANVSTGGLHRCAVIAGGTVACWGRGSEGQLGSGVGNPDNNFVSPTPVTVLSISTAAMVAAGGRHSCAAVSGGMDCWGLNDNGQLGDGTGGDRPIPVTVSGLSSKIAPTATMLPSPTPCPMAGCPTATNTPPPSPTPTPPALTGLDFSIGIDIDGNATDDCVSSGGPSTCTIPVGSTFVVRTYLNGLPADVPHYAGLEIRLTYAGVTNKSNASTQPWPECAFPVQHYAQTFIQFGCIIGVSGASSTYLGLIGTSVFTCSADGTITLEHNPDETHILDDHSASHSETPGTSESITVDCGAVPAATATPTPTAHSVGGLATNVSRGSAQDGLFGAIALGLLCGCGLLGFAGWRAVRRGSSR